MFLRSLTLKGFKSFADKTTLEFQPGVTVVVGPNGSGKSNLVDAVAWVLGAQGPRTMRGAKMDDVIFAGTPQRPSLGRAEVSLTIDNTSKLLPIEFTEVTVSRTLFRSGDSEYQVNGVPCRLLDIQELLSDTGIGRQQHVIVGQGQIDTVLNARPEDRRAIIEEAAGVLKFRKRRERSERRLEATEGNLLRLQDLLREVRRQLTPLQRQADAARRYGGVVEELRAIRLHLAGHEIAGLQTRIERFHDERGVLISQDSTLRAQLRELDERVLAAEATITSIGDHDLAEKMVRVESIRQHARGLRALIAEKQRSVTNELAAAADKGVTETLVADAAAARAALAGIDEEVEVLAQQAADVVAAEHDARAMRERFLEAFAAPSTSPGDELAAVRRELTARREASVRAENELARVAQRIETARRNIARLAVDRSEFAASVGNDETLLRGLVDQANSTVAAVADAERSMTAAEVRWREAESMASGCRARAEALRLALDSFRSKVGAERLSDVSGVLGPLVDHLEIEPGAEAAVGVALGEAMHSIIVEGPVGTRTALERLKHGDTEAVLFVTGIRPKVARHQVFANARPLKDCVKGSTQDLDAALETMLSGFMLVDGGWSDAIDFALANLGLVAVTRDGDRFGGGAWRAGGASVGGVTQAALDEAVKQTAVAETTRSGAEVEVKRLRVALTEAQASAAETEHRRRTVVDRLANTARSIDRLGRDQVAAETELENLLSEELGLRSSYEGGHAQVLELERVLPALENAAVQASARREARGEALADLERREAAVAVLRRDLEVRAAGLEERRTLTLRRLADLETRLARNPEAQAAAELRRSALAAKCDALAGLGDRLAGQLARG